MFSSGFNTYYIHAIQMQLKLYRCRCCCIYIKDKSYKQQTNRIQSINAKPAMFRFIVGTVAAAAIQLMMVRVCCYCYFKMLEQWAKKEWVNQNALMDKVCVFFFIIKNTTHTHTVNWLKAMQTVNAIIEWKKKHLVKFNLIKFVSNLRWNRILSIFLDIHLFTVWVRMHVYFMCAYYFFIFSFWLLCLFSK